ncbi:MAG TPA: M48 family metallopeptidase [Candidatus Limnocylindria bacterium]|jgi:hypothetical protein|nr:M48 family metallopeptidase [Candidatus Limnocylindria bacterium]
MSETDAQAFSPVDYFQGEIPRPKLQFRYRAALVVVCLAMVLLPLAYLALVAAVSWGVVWYAIHAFVLLEENRLPFIRYILYLTPVLSGMVIVFFLLKPFFAGTTKNDRSFPISHADHPELFQFLGRLCQLINTPLPSRVDVSCDVNASAGFREGLASVLGNDLVLHLGLPLVAGLNAREFAGLVAHELGHFAQGGGMRASFLVRSVNFWFLRVVYGRDNWDAWLNAASREGDWRFQLIALLARGGVWCSRQILRSLMFTGHAISCYLLRQMEFDADNYAAKVAGSEQAAGMLDQAFSLNVASQLAYQNLNRLWRERKLVDDFCALVVSERERIPAEARERMKASALEAKTGAFSTHPSDAERMDAIKKLAEPGIFVLDAPAACLFRDFPALCRAATKYHYEEENNLRLNEGNYKTVDEAIAVRETETANYNALSVIAPGAGSFWWPIPMDPAYVGAPADAAQTREALGEIANRVAETCEGVTETLKKWLETENRMLHLLAAKSLTEAGVTYESGHFGLADGSVALIEQNLAAKSAESDSLLQELQPHASHYSTRIAAGVQLLYDPAVSSQIPDAGTKQLEALRLVETLAKLQRITPALRELGRRVTQLQTVYQRANEDTKPDRLDRVATLLFRDLGRKVSLAKTELLGVRYPFEHASGPISLIDYCRPDDLGESEQGQNFNLAVAMLQRLPGVYSQSLSRLGALVAEVEWVCGISAKVPTSEPA